MESPTDFAKLGLGILLGIALILIQSTVLFLGILAKLTQWFLVQFLVGVWPILWALRVQPNGTMRSIGNAGISAFVTLVLLTIVQTTILRFLVEVPIVLPGGVVATLGNVLVTTLITIIGLITATLGLPIFAVKKVVPTTVQSTTKKTWMEGRDAVESYFGEDEDDTPAPMGRGPDGDMEFNRHYTNSQTNKQQVNMFFMDGPSGGRGSYGPQSGSGPENGGGSIHEQRHVGRLTENSTPGQSAQTVESTSND